MRIDEDWAKSDALTQGKRLFLTFDANLDDKLDAGEVTNLVQLANIDMGRYLSDPTTIFRSFDTDRSGGIDVQEATALITPTLAPVKSSFGQPGSVQPDMMQKYDLNRNGVLEPHERSRLDMERRRTRPNQPANNN